MLYFEVFQVNDDGSETIFLGLLCKVLSHFGGCSSLRTKKNLESSIILFLLNFLLHSLRYDDLLLFGSQNELLENEDYQQNNT